MENYEKTHVKPMKTYENPMKTHENTTKAYDNPIKNPVKTSRILSVFTVYYAARSAAAKNQLTGIPIISNWHDFCRIFQLISPLTRPS